MGKESMMSAGPNPEAEPIPEPLMSRWEVAALLVILSGWVVLGLILLTCAVVAPLLFGGLALWLSVPLALVCAGLAGYAYLRADTTGMTLVAVLGCAGIGLTTVSPWWGLCWLLAMLGGGCIGHWSRWNFERS